MYRTTRLPALIGLNVSATRPRAIGLAPAALTSAPSTGTPPAPAMAAAVMRTVVALIDATAISTGMAAIRMGAA